MWNHRVLATIDKHGETYFNIHEVYYNNKTKQPDGYTANPITIGGEDIEALKWTINKIQESLEKPILWGDSRFPVEYQNNK
jgi:hypothetical protein